MASCAYGQIDSIAAPCYRESAGADMDLVQVRFIVMNNVFQGALPIGKQYDLKGSTLGRTSGADAAKAGAVLKDLDLDIKLKLEEGWHDRCCTFLCTSPTCVGSVKGCILGQGRTWQRQRSAFKDSHMISGTLETRVSFQGGSLIVRCRLAPRLRSVLPACRLMTQLAADCALLEELRVMDYSLLLGIHARSSGWTSSPHATDRVSASLGSLPELVHGIGTLQCGVI